MTKEEQREKFREAGKRGAKQHEAVQLENGSWIEPDSSKHQNQLFGKVIEGIRLQMDYSLEAFGKLLGVGKQHIIKWESGSSGMTSSTKILLFDVLGTWLQENGLQWTDIPKYWFSYIPKEYRELRGWVTKTQVRGLLNDRPVIYDLEIIPPTIEPGVPIMRTGSTFLTNEQLVGKAFAKSAAKQIMKTASLKKALLDNSGDQVIGELKKKKMTASRLGHALFGDPPYQGIVGISPPTALEKTINEVKDSFAALKKDFATRLAEKDATIAAKDELIAELRDRIKELKGQSKADSTLSGILEFPVNAATDKSIEGAIEKPKITLEEARKLQHQKEKGE